MEDKIFSIIKDSKRFLITSDFFHLREATNVNAVRTAVERLEKKNKIKAVRTSNHMKLYCLSNKFEELKKSKNVKVDKKVFNTLTQDRRTLSFYEISESSGMEDDEVLKECLYR